MNKGLKTSDSAFYKFIFLLNLGHDLGLLCNYGDRRVV